MSHTSTVRHVLISSIPALREAAKELNSSGVPCALVENAKPRAYFSTQEGMGVAPYVLQLGAGCPYDVGFYPTQDGKGYEARTDLFMGHVGKLLGVAGGGVDAQQQLGRLYQLYAVHAATAVARAKGHMVSRRVKPDGTIALEVTGPGL
jgi:hypothetical protein